MAYSVDSDKNKENPVTPSVFGLSEQLLYKIASLDSAVQSGFRRIDENIERIRTDLHDSQLRTNDKVNEVDKRVTADIVHICNRLDTKDREGRILVEKYNDRMHAVETWQKVAMARASIIGAAIVIVWTFVAPTLRAVLGVPS